MSITSSHQPQPTAHYFASVKAGKFVVISQDERPVGKTIKVSGKVMAREVAQLHDAKCWNF